MAKPDPAIYLHTLQRLGTRPDEALFIDDKRLNVDAAIALGMKSVQFSTIDRLRTDLVAAGLETELPLP
jgi:putative hydrolase of the HAD superfamily